MNNQKFKQLMKIHSLNPHVSFRVEGSAGNFRICPDRNGIFHLYRDGVEVNPALLDYMMDRKIKRIGGLGNAKHHDSYERQEEYPTLQGKKMKENRNRKAMDEPDKIMREAEIYVQEHNNESFFTNIDEIRDSRFVRRAGRISNVYYVEELRKRIASLLKLQVQKAILPEMEPEELTIEDGNDNWYKIPYMGTQDVLMWKTDNADVYVTRDIDRVDSSDFNVVNLIHPLRSSLRNQLTGEYRHGPIFSPAETCEQATGRMIGYRRMINDLFAGYSGEKVIDVRTIADKKIRDAVCQLYNEGIELNARLCQIDLQADFE